MVKFFGDNCQVFISKKQKDLAVKSIQFLLKWYAKMSFLYNLEFQPNIDNQPPNVLYIVVLVLIFELNWWIFLETMARYLSQKSKKIWQSKAFSSF